MDEERPRRRQTPVRAAAARTKRIWSEPREGWTYDEVAGEVGLKERRVRQIVTELLKEREAVSGSRTPNAGLTGSAGRWVAGDALARGDIRAIAPFIRVTTSSTAIRRSQLRPRRGRRRSFMGRRQVDRELDFGRVRGAVLRR